jgi:hypothetical protein
MRIINFILNLYHFQFEVAVKFLTQTAIIEFKNLD